MNYANPQLRDALASEYALGSLHGPARRRFERLLQQDAALRQSVAEWQERLAPMNEAVPPVAPPPRVWRNIEARLRRANPRPSLWQNLNFWRGLALLGSGAAVALLLYFGVGPRDDAGPRYLITLADKDAKPFMVVNYSANKGVLQLQVINPPAVGAEQVLELWGLPAGGAPQSLGLLPASGKTEVKLSSADAQALTSVPALAVSLEPKGGSPTGQPTGPVLFTGPVIRL